MLNDTIYLEILRNRLRFEMLKKFLEIFSLGMFCFTISQLILRIPILNILNNNLTVYNFNVLYPLLSGILITFSAGIFEETARFIFKDRLLMSNNLKSDAIFFGLGHSTMEILYIIFVGYESFYFLESSIIFITIYERIIATIIHVGMTVLIWNGFASNKKYKYLIIAIVLHGILDSLIAIVNIFNISLLFLYGFWTFMCIIILIYVYKIDLRGGVYNEKV